MKMRKILARGIALASCIAMLSTNVLAASELTITASENNGALKATISGAVSGQVTFLAVDKDSVLASVADADIQYIAQEEKALSRDTVIQFAQRTGGDNRVDLYAGGMSVTEVAHLKGVYIVGRTSLNPATVSTINVNKGAVPTTNDGWKALLYDNVKVDVEKIGATAAETITLNATTAADFAVAATAVDDDTYTLNVSYKDAAIATIGAEVVVDVTSITVNQPSTPFTYYIDAADAFDADRAKAAIIANGNITVTANYDGGSFAVDLADATYAVSGTDAITEVVVSYAGVTAAETVKVNVVTRAVAGVETATGSLRVNFADLGAADINSVTPAMVDTYVTNNVGRAGFAPKYTWNDSTKPAEAIPSSNYAFDAAVLSSSNAEASVYTVAVKTAAAKDGVAAGTVIGSIEVTVTAVQKTLITGSVSVSDTTGQVADFASLIPAGAVVTAMKTNADGLAGNYYGSDEAFEAKYAVVDESGNFQLEVEEGEYTVIVAHTKYVIADGALYISRSIIDENSMQTVSIGEGETKNLNNIALKYAFFGDVDQDGSLNGNDYSLFTMNFGSSVN